MSERELLVCHSHATIEASTDIITDTIADYENRGTWDGNYGEGYFMKRLTDDTDVHYIRTKRVAMVSPRDQILVVNAKII